MNETRLTVRRETRPARCEICHQADRFNPETGDCERCALIRIPDEFGLIAGTTETPGRKRSFITWVLLIWTGSLVVLGILFGMLFGLTWVRVVPYIAFLFLLVFLPTSFILVFWGLLTILTKLVDLMGFGANYPDRRD